MMSNILEGKVSQLCPRMNLFVDIDRVLIWLDVAKPKKNLPDDTDETALLSLFLSSCPESEFQIMFPCRKIPERFARRLSFQRLLRPKLVYEKAFQVYSFHIRFPKNFKWEDKGGLAFCAPSDEDSNHSMFSVPHFRCSSI